MVEIAFCFMSLIVVLIEIPGKHQRGTQFFAFVNKNLFTQWATELTKKENMQDLVFTTLDDIAADVSASKGLEYID